MLELVRSFDWRCLGFAPLVPIIEVFRRVSFSLPLALTQGGASSHICMAALAGGIVLAAIGMLVSIKRGRAMRLALQAAAGTAMGIAAFAGMAAILAYNQSDGVTPLLIPVSYLLLGASLATLFAGWIKAYANQHPLAGMACFGLAILVGNLAQPWVIANRNPLVMAGILAAFLTISGILLAMLGIRQHDYGKKERRNEPPAEPSATARALRQNCRPVSSARTEHNSEIQGVDTEQRSLREMLHASATASAFGFVLIFFSWGVMAIPPHPYVSDHKALVYFLGNAVAFGIAIWLAWSLRTAPRYSMLRQRAFFILPVFAIFLAYFSFIRMLDANGTLKDMLSIGFNMSVAGFSTLFAGTTIMRLRERGLAVEIAVAPVLIACMLAYILGALAYERFGNTAMYFQVVIITLYILALSSISTRKASLNDEERIARRCGEIASQCGLSAREHEILLLLASDYSIDKIADRLTISIETVRTHKKRIYAKTGTHKHEDLMRMVRAPR